MRRVLASTPLPSHRATKTHRDFLPRLFGPFLGGKFFVSLLLLCTRKGRIRHLTPCAESEFHSFQQSMSVLWSITSTFRFRCGSKVVFLQDVQNGKQHRTRRRGSGGKYRLVVPNLVNGWVGKRLVPRQLMNQYRKLCSCDLERARLTSFKVMDPPEDWILSIMASAIGPL